MDEKLAKGLARELFRKLKISTKAETSPRTPIVAELLRKYTEDGGVREWDVFEVASHFEKEMQNVCAATSLHLVRHPIRRKAIIATGFQSSIEGSEQFWMVGQSNTYVSEKSTLRIIETVHHAALAQHAVSRLYERGEPDDGSMVRSVFDKITLWTYPILLSLSGEKAWKPAVPGTQIAIPYKDGLLLGTLEINYFEGPEQGPTITTCKRGGHKMRRIAAPFAVSEDAIMTLSVNTFVGRQELFANQQIIVDVLEQFENRFQSAMKNMRQLVVLGYPDEEIPRLIGPPQFNRIDVQKLQELSERVQIFFQTDEWRQHSEAHRRPTRFLQ